jgi:dTDP-4-dehydrorhamnose 3,5-epimerase-like enzyme
MQIKITSRHLNGLVVVEPEVFEDERGFFTEVFRADQFQALGLPVDFVQVYAPAGFARGFCVLSDAAEIQYKCTGIYNSRAEAGILWNDPALGIEWPVKDPILSDKDSRARTLEQWLASPESDQFIYRP